VHQYLQSQGYENPLPGHAWATRFMNRHKDELTKRRGASLSILRVKSMTRQKINHFYDILDELFGV